MEDDIGKLLTNLSDIKEEIDFLSHKKSRLSSLKMPNVPDVRIQGEEMLLTERRPLAPPARSIFHIGEVRSLAVTPYFDSMASPTLQPRQELPPIVEQLSLPEIGLGIEESSEKSNQ